MSNPNPTGTGYAVALTVPADHRPFLRRTFGAVQAGLLGDLADAHGRLLDQLATGGSV